MTVFLPLVLLAPVMILLSAMLSLASHGPLGWLAAAALLAAVSWACWWVGRAARAWWASTKAPPFY